MSKLNLMRNSFIKGRIQGFSTFVIIVITIIIGCSKSVPFEEPIPESNPPLTIHSSELVDIRATDVYTKYDSLQRKIEIIDKINDTVKDVFFITLKSNDFKNNIYTQLKNKTFTGTLSIISNEEILFIMSCKNGVNLATSTNEQHSNIKSNRVPSCNLTVVHNCVANKIRQMSIFDYSECLVTAPACYGGLWASCGWTNCITGEQNVNLKN